MWTITLNIMVFLLLDKIEVPIIRIFGATARGNSVLIHLQNYEPYFYVQVLSGSNFIQSDITKLMNRINGNESHLIKRIELTDKYPLMPYTDAKSRFLKIFTYTPKQVSEVRCKKINSYF